MADAKIVQEWLAKADDDLAFVNSILNDTTFFAQVCFHLHQAAEKYLKAVIVARDLEFKKVHDLNFLLSTCLHCASSGLVVGFIPACAGNMEFSSMGSGSFNPRSRGGSDINVAV